MFRHVVYIGSVEDKSFVQTEEKEAQRSFVTIRPAGELHAGKRRRFR